MKIIEMPAPWSERHRCTECGALLEIELEDLVIGDFGIKWGDPEIELEAYFKCPLCKANNFPEKESLPQAWYHNKLDEWRDRNR